MNHPRTAARDEDEFGLDTKSRLREVYEWLEGAAAARAEEQRADASGPDGSGYSVGRDA